MRLIGARFVVGAGFCAAGLIFLTLGGPITDAKTVEELRAELDEKREDLKDTQAKIKKFKEDIQLKKREANTLAGQIELLDDSIDEVQLSIQRTLLEIEKTTLEIQEIEAEIGEREAEIGIQKARLGGIIRELHAHEQQSTVAVFLKYRTFSEAVHETESFHQLQQRGQELLDDVQKLRAQLEEKKHDLEDFKETLESLQERQEAEQKRLNGQKSSKARILDLTNAQEREYQALLKQAQATHQAAQADIAKLDDLIREELRKRGVDSLPGVGKLTLPIPANFGYSCVFHCSGYPYAYLIGAHSGLDIPAPVGTPIRAPADGYIARNHDSGGPGYSYIMLLHGDNVTTVYGHVSGFAVDEGELVPEGTVIGYTGGAPGMRGAGLSTGAHLHWEVRVNNVPQNPEKYL